MPKVKANNLTMNYDQQGSRRAADPHPLSRPPTPPVMPSRWPNTSKHFTCISH